MFKKTAPVLTLISLLLVFFFDVVFLGKTLSTSSLLPGMSINGPYGFNGYKPNYPFSIDAGGHAWTNEPNPYIISNIIKEGHLPLWNPHEGLGIPLLANPNSEVINPIKFFLNLYPTPFLQDMFFLLRLFLAGILTYLFLREKRLSEIASLFGAVSFMLSGYSIWWINLHPLSSIMYIPGYFYFYERWENRRKAKDLFSLSICIALSIIAGKIHDVVMGSSVFSIYTIQRGFSEERWKGIIIRLKILLLVFISSFCLSAFYLFPVLELNLYASPLAKSIRTGSAGHTLPLLTSISLWQPLFLGWKNYLYNSWLQWKPDIMVFYSGMTVLLLFIYGCFDKRVLKENLSFVVFSSLLFLQLFGLLPYWLIPNLPIFRDITFLKYHSMLHFSLSVISASSLERLMEDKKKIFYIALGIVVIVITIYFYSLLQSASSNDKLYIGKIMAGNLLFFIVIGIIFYVFKKRVLGCLILGVLVLELYLYMPKDHPNRYFPYKEPPILKVIKEEHPYRIIGDGDIIPPLISNANGLYDIRGIDVLVPKDYYLFFENLISFSVPYTNYPDILIAGTSPWIDLLGVKYILTKERLEQGRLEMALKRNIISLRWIRFFEAMKNHNIKGGRGYGFHEIAGERRFSLFFNRGFKFKSRITITEPYLFVGLAVKDGSEENHLELEFGLDDSRKSVILKDIKGWNDYWINVSNLIGKTIDVILEDKGYGKGEVVLGDFGLSPGYEEEKKIGFKLIDMHSRELGYLKFKGVYGDINLYENENVMNRAFILHRVKQAEGIYHVIKELQNGLDFREMGLVGEDYHYSILGEGNGDKIVIKRYAPQEIVLEVESKGGLLVLSDLYYPGWRVKVNGKDKDVIRVFGALRGVIVNGGKSEVRFYYNPLVIKIGLLVSLVSITAWTVFLCYHKRRRG
ncbi:MAG: YfhO family protein [Thermodesulfovibrionales bacterium]